MQSVTGGQYSINIIWSALECRNDMHEKPPDSQMPGHMEMGSGGPWKPRGMEVGGSDIPKVDRSVWVGAL